MDNFYAPHPRALYPLSSNRPNMVALAPTNHFMRPPPKFHIAKNPQFSLRLIQGRKRTKIMPWPKTVYAYLSSMAIIKNTSTRNLRQHREPLGVRIPSLITNLFVNRKQWKHPLIPSWSDFSRTSHFSFTKPVPTVIDALCFSTSLDAVVGCNSLY